MIILIIFRAIIFIMEKVCFKCNRLLPLTDYYVHKQMGDGHLNKCKSCTKSDVKKDYERKVVDSSWKESERARGRKKYHRLYTDTGKANPTAAKAWLNKFPEKKIALNRSSHISKKGFEKHHWSYNEPHWKDIIWLTKKEHSKAHRFVVYDQERMMYRRYDTNELLDTKEAHITFINWCLENKED